METNYPAFVRKTGGMKYDIIDVTVTKACVLHIRGKKFNAHIIFKTKYTNLTS